MSDETYDDNARRFAAIFPGRALDQQITNEEYLISRGGGNSTALALMKRGRELRALDAPEATS